MSMKSRVANQRPLVTLQFDQRVFGPNLILPTWTQCSCTPSNLVTSPPAWTGDETTAASSKKAKAMRIMISQDYWFGTTLALLNPRSMNYANLAFKICAVRNQFTDSTLMFPLAHK